jgi:hypothetical protein
MNFEPMEFVNSLQYMAQGMVGIFAVILVIIGVTTLLNKLAK